MSHKAHARTSMYVPEQKSQWCHTGGVGRICKITLFLTRLFNFLFMSIYIYCRVFNKRNRFVVLDSSIYYSIALMSIFHTSSAGKGSNVCHHITDSTGFLHQALWVSGRRWFWITSAASLYLIFILSTKQPWHLTVYSLHNSPDNKCLHGETSSFALLKRRNDCKYTPNSLSTEGCLPREPPTVRPLSLV